MEQLKGGMPPASMKPRGGGGGGKKRLPEKVQWFLLMITCGVIWYGIQVIPSNAPIIKTLWGWINVIFS